MLFWRGLPRIASTPHWSPLPVSDDRVETLPLFDEPFWFAEPEGRSAVNTSVMKEAELRGQPLLLLAEGHCLRDQALAICQAAPREGHGDFSATSLETIRQMVATGLGTTLVWRRSYPKARDLQLLAQTLRDRLPQSVQGINLPRRR